MLNGTSMRNIDNELINKMAVIDDNELLKFFLNNADSLGMKFTPKGVF